MAPARAAAHSAPPWPAPAAFTLPGATSTTRSWFKSSARSTRLVTLSPAAPATTAMRSFRAAEQSSTMARKACCTVRVVESHTTTATSSRAAAVAKAAV